MKPLFDSVHILHGSKPIKLQNRRAPELWKYSQIFTTNLRIHLKKVVLEKVHGSFSAKHVIQNGHQSTSTFYEMHFRDIVSNCSLKAFLYKVLDNVVNDSRLQAILKLRIEVIS